MKLKFRTQVILVRILTESTKHNIVFPDIVIDSLAVHHILALALSYSLCMTQRLFKNSKVNPYNCFKDA